MVASVLYVCTALVVIGGLWSVGVVVLVGALLVANPGNLRGRLPVLGSANVARARVGGIALGILAAMACLTQAAALGGGSARTVAAPLSTPTSVAAAPTATALPNATAVPLPTALATTTPTTAPPTLIPATATSVPPTATSEPPTPLPPSPTTVPASSTPVAPAATSTTLVKPPVAPSYPAGVTAQCGDGSYSFSKTRSGTCSHHSGVAVWINSPSR